MYVENIMDHFNNPRNYGRIENASISLRELNPLCGDLIEVFAIIKNGKLERISFTGKGCAISQAAASLLTEEITGKTIPQVKKITNDEMVKLLAIPISPVRLKCALLALKTVEKGIHIYEGKNNA